MNTDVKGSFPSTFGSETLDQMVNRLNQTSDPKRRYEYVLWLAKKLSRLSPEVQQKSIQVKGCVSQVFVFCKMIDGRLYWEGDSDAPITRGLLSLLINGLTNLTPEEVLSIDPRFIEATGLHSSLTPSRANGFLNILLTMKNIAKQYISSKDS